MLPATTQRPSEDTWRSLLPTFSLIPTQPEKSVRKRLGVNEETNDVPAAGGVVVVVVDVVVDVLEDVVVDEPVLYRKLGGT